MKKYRVRATVTISVSTLVEASSKEEALLMAEERPMCPVGSASSYGATEEEYWCHSGELDGDAERLEIDE